MIQSMGKTINIKWLFALSLMLCAWTLLSQSNSHWIQVEIPVNENITYINFFSKNYGIAAGKKLMEYHDNSWYNFENQAPKNIDAICALDTNSIFISHNTKYQESKLYYWNGKYWNALAQPLVNSISAMDFKDENNGTIAGYGEIALYKNGKWYKINPPSNNSITHVILLNDSHIWALIKNEGLYYYSGKWTKVENSKQVFDIFLYKKELFVAGNYFIGKAKDDSIEIISDFEYKKRPVLSKMFVLNPSDIYLTGVNGILLHYSNKSWDKIELNTKVDINDIKMINEYDGWIGVDEGILFHFTNNAPPYSRHAKWKGFDETNYFNSFNAKVVDDEYGVVTADFNRDGLVDIFTCGLFEENHLYINRGNISFIDKARLLGVNGSSVPDEARELNLGACAADFDNDNDIDLYVGVLNGKNKLYENISAKYFIDYSKIAGGIGIKTDRTNAVISGDIDNDGDLDLFIVNEHSTNRLYLNNGAGIFTEKTGESGLKSINGGMACSFGDIDNDGDLDLYVANWSRANTMYKNLLKESGELSFEDISTNSKTKGDPATKSNAVVFADIDNDGDLDLYVTNRKTSNKLYINNGKGIFADKTTELTGIDNMKSNGAVIADFDGNGWKDIYVSNVGENIYFENINGHFYKKKTGFGGYSTGSACADFDNDGDLDLYVANYIGESSSMLINKLNNNNFIKIKIEGIKNNRSGIGTKIYVYKDKGLNNMKQLIDFRQINGGSGYASMNQLTQTIQIQENKFVDVKAVFPNGIVKKFKHLNAKRYLYIQDLNGMEKQLFLIKKYILRRLLDPHELYELIKKIFILFFVLFMAFRGYRRYNWPVLFTIIISLLLLSIYYLQYHFLEYHNFFFATLLPVASVTGLILLLHQIFERKLTKKYAIVEQEQIREKLSRDLHDDLASTISSIGIYLALIRHNIAGIDNKSNKYLSKAESLVSDAANSITDLIWAIKSKPESLSNLFDRIKYNFSSLLMEKSINFKLEIDSKCQDMILHQKTKQNIYLIIKEAINNILKYANAEKVLLKATKTGRKTVIIIDDNGVGFDIVKAAGKGHGLTNMQKRAEDIGAKLKIISNKETGTKLLIEIR